MERSQQCQMCGSSEWQWDPEQGGDEDAYEAMQSVCPGCQRKDWLREDSDSLPAGATITLVPRAVARRLADAPKRAPRRRRKRVPEAGE